MKKLLVVLSVAICSITQAQFSRSFFTTSNNGTERDAILASTSSGIVFASLKNSTTDNLILVVGELDAEGETSDYAEITINGVQGNYFTISGFAVNGDELILAVLADRTTYNELTYLTFDRLTDQLTSQNTDVQAYQKGFVRSRQSGNDLITYISTDQNELRRVSVSVNNTGSSTYQVIDNNEAYSSSLINFRKMIELLIDDSGIEFAQRDNKLYRRLPNTTVDTLMMTAWLPINGYDLVVDGNGDLNVFSGYKFNVIDTSSLTISNSGDITGMATAMYQRLETVSTPSGFAIYGQISGNNDLQYVKVNSAYSATSQMGLPVTYFPFDLQENEADYYVCGAKQEPTGDYSVGIIATTNTQDPLTFYEYNSEFDHFDLRANTGHLNIMFNDQRSGTSGLNYDLNGMDRSLVYLASNGLLGKGGTGDIRGILGGFSTDDYNPGPYTTNGNAIDAMPSYDMHNRAYYVSKDMIDYHLQNLGQVGYEMPFGIAHWPAHGNVSLGQAQDIAPFFDYDGNGTYDPMAGDYPSIYGDHCFLNVYHLKDNTTTFGQTDVKVECLRYIYTFDCDTSEAIKNTIFVTQDYVLRDGQLDSAYASVFMDGDFGGAGDDYVGTFVDLGMIYFYNGDMFDENNSGIQGYGDTLGGMGMLFLKGAPVAADGMDNNPGVGAGLTVNGYGYGDGIQDNEFLGLSSSYRMTNGDGPGVSANTNAEYYNTYKGLFADGTPQMANGTQIHHSYYGNSEPQFYTSDGIDPGSGNFEYGPLVTNLSGDRRMLGSSGPYSMSVDDPNLSVFKITTAYIAGIDILNSPFTDFKIATNLLYDYGVSIRDMFAANDAGCDTDFDFYVSPIDITGLEEKELKTIVYPNPLKSELNVLTEMSGNIEIRAYDMTGKEIVVSEGGQFQQLETSNWQSGVYLLVITNGSEVAHQKVVKR